MKGYALVTGETFPVKDQLRKLGGRWDAGKKGWWIPEARESEARKLVGSKSRGGGSKKPATCGKSVDFSAFRPTAEQAALADFILIRPENLFCEAGAGAGKTTTALWLVHLMLQRSNGALDVVFVTFGSDTREDVAEKAPDGAEVVTFNALGFRALMRAWNRKPNVDKELLWETFRAYGATDAKLKERGAFYGQVKRLIDLGKGALAETAEDLSILVIDHDLALENGEAAEAVALAQKIMDDARADRSPRAVIDFNDQMWLAVVHNLALPQYDVVVIDECQDTNELQLELVHRCTVHANARVVAVGDRRQSIYRFRGADSRAVDAIIERFSMERLPLMTTFRCAKSIVREAQAIVPEYRAGESNPEGVVRSIKIESLLEQIKPGDFVISRTNAPLISYCIRAMARGIPAAVVGRGVGTKLSGLVKRLLSRCNENTVHALEQAATDWARLEIEKLEKKIPVRETAIENVSDNVACIMAFCEGASSVAEVLARIEAVIRDNGSAARVDFTTCHKAKGRERERVFLFRDTFMRPKKDRRTGAWLPPSEEEANLLYVGITRAKTELVYVDDAKKGAL